MNRVIYLCILTSVILLAGCTPPPADAGLTANPTSQAPSAPGGDAHHLPGYPPPRPVGQQRRPVTSRVVNMDTAPHRELLATLQREIHAGDSASLAARVGSGSSLNLYRAGSYEGGTRFNRQQIQLALDTLFEAGSRPSIHGFFQETSVYSSFVCVGVVTEWWNGTVALPEGDPYYGESLPRNLPEGWAGWRLCSDDGQASWWWDAWAWGGRQSHDVTTSSLAELVFGWPENESWDWVAVDSAGTFVPEYVLVVP